MAERLARYVATPGMKECFIEILLRVREDPPRCERMDTRICATDHRCFRECGYRRIPEFHYRSSQTPVKITIPSSELSHQRFSELRLLAVRDQHCGGATRSSGS